MKIDAFCHVLPRPYYDRLQQIQTAGAANLLKRTAPIASLYDMDERERIVEPFGDDYRQIISLAAPQIEALGEPETTEQVPEITPAIERKVARLALQSLRLEGLDELQASFAELQRLAREFERQTEARNQRARALAKKRRAIALLLLAA